MILDCELYLLDFPVAGKVYDVPALELCWTKLVSPRLYSCPR